MPGRPPKQSDADREAAERAHAEAMAKINKRNVENLRGWRFMKLTEAGLSAVAADLLLSWPQAGWLTEECLTLLKKGCPPATALDLLRPVTLPASEEAPTA